MSQSLQRPRRWEAPGPLVQLCYRHSGPAKFSLGKMDHNLGTVTKSVVVFIPHDSLTDLTSQHPRIAACLWRETHADAAISRQWMVNLGRRSAQSRLAHLLCELA